MNAPQNLRTDEPAHWQLDEVVAGLRAARTRWRDSRGRRADLGRREFPSPERVEALALLLRAVLFPARLGPADLRRESEDYFVGHALDEALHALVEQVGLELGCRAGGEGARPDPALLRGEAHGIVRAFAHRLPALRTLLDSDVEAAFRGDPAAQSVDEVLLCYPGVQALVHHRIAHQLHRLGVPLIARIVAEIAHSETGIDIHPGASIGGSFFIDHGTGVVIGETAVIGERVRIYQAVTLGAKRFETAADGALAKGRPRHPVVEDDVVIYAGATILGRITIGRGSSIGGNVWLTRSVPPGSQITQARSEHAGGSSP